MAEYELSRLARNDLKEIYKFGAVTWGHNQAERYARALYDCFQLIADFPRIGRRDPELRANMFRFAHGSHFIFYEASADNVAIARVVHGAQDWRSEFGN